MPASLEAATVFAALIVPGLLIASGYNRTRAHTVPQRDLYAIAQAIVLSLIWLPVIWLLGGGSVVDWSSTATLEHHQLEVVAYVMLNLGVALAAGLVAGKLVDAVGERPAGNLARVIAWTGTFRPPTPWDYFWLRAATGEWAAVEIQLADGRAINVLFDRDSDVGLSPNPRQAFFDSEYVYVDDGELEVLPHQGIFIDCAEVVSLRLEHLELKSEASTE
jgi:hypothetical protein